MKKLSKFSLWKVICCLSLVIGLGISGARAQTKPSSAQRNCRNTSYMQTYMEKIKNFPIGKDVTNPEEIEAARQKLLADYQGFINTCTQALQKFPELNDVNTRTWGFLWQNKTDAEYTDSFKKALAEISNSSDYSSTQQYNARTLLKNYETYNKRIDNDDASMYTAYKGSPCGDKFPFGCPIGTVCKETNVSYSADGFSDTTMRSISCQEDSSTPLTGSSHEVNGAAVGSVTMNVSGPSAISQVTTSEGNTKTQNFHMSPDWQKVVTFEGLDEFNTTGDVIDFRTNEACHIDQLKDRYMGTCYSCVVVSALISTFMSVADKVEPLMQMAGTKLLFIGMMIWLPIYILSKLSSFVSLEPMKMVQELLTFFFKCLLAYTLITSGLRMISTLIVNPLLIAGADYGIAIVDGVMPDKLNIDGVSEDNKSYRLAASNSIDRKVFDKIMTISKKADAAVSLNFVIGNALFCHSYHAGAISFKIPISETTSIPFYFPDFWLMLCGAVIWFFAFMVVMGVNFYLLDLSFKIGFALMALPITIGLWPFNKFKGKFTDCLKIIINAAGTFMFLGISTGISIVLISSALGGTDKLLQEINANNQEYVSQLFSLTGSSFLIILFAFLYSHNLISETVSKLTDKFFGSMMSGITPMNELTTQTIDFAKKQIGNAASIVTGGVGSMASTAVKSAATQVARKAVNAVRGKGKKESK